MQQYQEENNYPKAIAFSVATMGLLLAISYFIIIGMPVQEEVGTGGIIVNYGTSESGMGDDYMSVDEPSMDPNANNTPPDNVSQTPSETPSVQSSDQSVVTQDVEDAVSVSKEEKKSSTPPTTAKEEKRSEPAVNQNALYKGRKNNATGTGDGTGNTPGNQGEPDGDPLSPNYGKGGSGFGNVNLSLANRRFVDIPQIEDKGQSSGKVAVEIRVDRTGTVVYARAGAKGTTLSDLSLWTKCERAVLGARLNQLESAPDVQIGVVIFNFKVK
ncbi:MAG TPA: energy transducer TonB [Sphingobacteriaceae bacterium]